MNSTSETTYINHDSLLSKLTMELTKVNILGNLMSDYGLPGENLARQIFSYMALSSLKQGRLVCIQGSKIVDEHFETKKTIFRIFEQENVVKCLRGLFSGTRNLERFF